MVQAMIQISNEANQILNIVKAKHALRDKSHAIEKVILDYAEEILEPQLRPEFIEKIRKIEKEPTIKIRTIENFDKHFGL